VGVIGEALGHRIPFEEMTPTEFRRISEGTAPGAVVDMLLAAWSAAVGRPAYVTTAVADILGTPPRTLRQWASDHAAAFARGA
jgi:cobalamin biosynthesis protein CobT